MTLTKISKAAIAGMLFVSLFSFSGCGNKYESEITKQVQQECKIPDSFRKVDYKIDEKNGLAWLDYKAKNPMGQEIPGRAYFTVTSDGFKQVPTHDIDKQILEDFAKEDPSKFAECVIDYVKIKRLWEKYTIDAQVLHSIYDQLNGSNKKNYFMWDQSRNLAITSNKSLKAVKDAYNNSPTVVQGKFPKVADAKYLKIELTGDFFKFSAKGEGVDEYPEME